MNELVTRIKSYGEQMTEMPFSGISTFFRTDLVPGGEGIEIGLIGVPTDAGLSHRPGARYGPQAVRSQSALIRYINSATKVIPYEHARVADLGDVPLLNVFDLNLLHEEIVDFYKKVQSKGILPLSVGGDHSISFPILEVLGQGQPLSLIHFDSHHDTTPPLKGTKFHHGAPFRNAIEAGVIDPKRSIQIAIRDPYEEITQPYVSDQGMHFVEMPEVDRLGPDAVAARIRDIVGENPAYISFDVDALDPSVAPGTGTPVVGGLTSREAMRMIQALNGLHVVGGDVVEVSPPYDAGEMTALVGAQILFEILCVASLSKRRTAKFD